MPTRKDFLLSDLKNHLRLKTNEVEKIQLIWIDEKGKETVISEIDVPIGHNPLGRKF